MNILIFEYFASLLVITSLIVFVHELGHLVMARLLKVPVTKFSVGCCTIKKLKWSKSFRRGITRYCFAFPFVGEGQVTSLTSNKLKRLLIVSGGFIAECLAILFFVLTNNYFFAQLFLFSVLFYSLGETKAGVVDYFGVAGSTFSWTITFNKKLIDIFLDIDYENSKIKLWREIRPI